MPYGYIDPVQRVHEQRALRNLAGPPQPYFPPPAQPYYQQPYYQRPVMPPLLDEGAMALIVQSGSQYQPLPYEARRLQYDTVQQDNGAEAIAAILVIGAMAAFLLGRLLYDGVLALSQRPPRRVSRVALAVAAVTFLAVRFVPAHGSHWILATVLATIAGTCALGAWRRHVRGLP